jgi:thiol-disulfide isomerase/thioredoxin
LEFSSPLAYFLLCKFFFIDIRNGQLVSHYRNLKKRKYLTQYAKRLLKFKRIRTLSPISTVEKWTGILASDDFLVIGHFPTNQSVSYHKFQEISGKFTNGLPFYSMVTPHFAHFQLFLEKTLYISSPMERGSALWVYSKEKNEIIRMPSHIHESTKIVDWISENTKLNIVEISPMNFKDFSDSKKPTLIWFLNDNDTSQNENVQRDFQVVFNQFDDEFAYAYLDGMRFAHIFDQIFENKKLPQLVLLLNKEYWICKDCGSKSPYTEMIKFIDSHHSGKLAKVFKSRETPNELSFNSLKEFSKNITTQQFCILFYRPGCGHCHFFIQFFEDLKKRIQMDGLMITKYNLLNNSPPTIFPVEYIPTIIYMKRENGNLVASPYKGSRTVSEIQEWIESQYTVQVTQPIT